MSNSITKSAPLLEDVNEAFVTWRENRGNRRKIPDSLCIVTPRIHTTHDNYLIKICLLATANITGVATNSKIAVCGYFGAEQE